MSTTPQWAPTLPTTIGDNFATMRSSAHPLKCLPSCFLNRRVPLRQGTSGLRDHGTVGSVSPSLHHRPASCAKPSTTTPPTTRYCPNLDNASHIRHFASTS